MNVSIISILAVAIATGWTIGSNFGRDISWSTRIDRVSHEPDRTRIQEAPNSPSENASVKDAATTAGPLKNENLPCHQHITGFRFNNLA